MRPQLKPAGVAFDTNLLLKPTSRRLAACWMESAGHLTMVLPAVAGELTLSGSEVVAPSAAANAAAWRKALADEKSVYRMVRMDAQAIVRAGTIVDAFTLPCFPRLVDQSEIASNADAIILAQGLAMGMDVVLTNNMQSIDHHEVNALVRDELGRNAPFVSSLDDAFCAQHAVRGGGERMLRLLMASDWPLDGADMTLAECHDRVAKLAERLAGGLRMPNTADRMLNAFETSGRLSEIAEAAQRDAQRFLTLREENMRKSARTPEDSDSPAGRNGEKGSGVLQDATAGIATPRCRDDERLLPACGSRCEN